ncbi:MAG: glycoside hydrolase family 5 protein [Phycisphaerae bacterium]
MQHLLLIIAVALLLPAVGVIASPHDLARERAAGFVKGVNLSHWYAQSMHGYGEDHLSTYLTEADFALIRDMGFDHVRLTLSERVLFDPDSPGVLRAEALERFKQRVDSILDHELNVIVDLHPGDAYKKQLATAPAAEAFAADWGALAAAMADTDPSRVMFEIINEPSPFKPEAWRPVQLQAVVAIRKAAPSHTIVVSGGGWTGAEQLAGFEPYDLPNLVYTFHWYEPHMYTHQSAGWGWWAAKEVGGMSWPLAAEAAAEAGNYGENEEALKHLRHQIEKGWFMPAWAEAKLDEVVTWQKKHDMPPVYVGEFGVYRKSAEPEGRYRWHAATVEAFEARGWGWAIWDYAGGFAVTKEMSQKHPRTPDEKIVEALGLKPRN